MKIKDLYDFKQAAEYLDTSISNLKYHVHVAKNLSGSLLGHSLIFTKKELDDFQKNRRKPGRPKENKS